MAICSATSYPFGFPSRSKRPPLDIPKILVTIFNNQDKKVAFIRVDEDVSLEISSEFMSTCPNMNIIVESTGGYASYLNGKSESTNNKLANITRSLLLNLIHKKELCSVDYQYAIWLFQRTENMLCGDVP